MNLDYSVGYIHEEINESKAMLFYSIILYLFTSNLYIVTEDCHSKIWHETVCMTKNKDMYL